MNTADILSKVRKARGLTVQELAEKSGVCWLTIVNIEAGKTSPRMDTMIQIMRALDYNVVFQPRYKGGYIDE